MTVSATKSNHALIVTIATELIGVGLIAVIAGMSDAIGKIMVTLMVGFLLIWLMSNISQLQSIVGKT